jgi:hypothetical protein
MVLTRKEKAHLQPVSKAPLLGRIVLLMWVILCLSIFIAYPGRVSHINQFIFRGWGTISSVHTLLFPGSYIWSLFVSFLGVLAFSIACTALGSLILNLLVDCLATGSRTGPYWMSYFATAFLLGQTVSSCVFLVLAGLFRITRDSTIIGVIFMVLIGAYPLSMAIRMAWKDQSLKMKGLPEQMFSRLLLWLGIAVLFLPLLSSSARLSYDSVAIYFSGAKATAMASRIQYFANDSFIVSSFHPGIQYTAIILIFGDQAARMYSWVGAVISIIFVLGLGERLGLSRSASVILLSLVLTSTAFLDLMGDGKIDLIVAASALAAIYWIVHSLVSSSRYGVAVLVGLVAGFAVISRPFNGFLLPLFILSFYMTYHVIAGRGKGHDLKYIIIFLSGIAVGTIPLLLFHLFANWMILGEPLAFLANASILNTSVWQWSFDPMDIWVYRVLYPFVITFVNSPQSLGNISPLLLAFTPMFFIPDFIRKMRLSAELIALLVASATTLTLWILFFFTVEEVRYVFFLWFIIFIPLAMLLEIVVESKSRLLRTLVMVSLTGTLIFIGLRTTLIAFATYSPIAKDGSPQCGPSPFCDLLGSVNDKAAAGDRVLTLNAYRYYLRQDLFACSTKAQEYLLLRNAWENGSDSFWREVYRQGYRYITFEKNYTNRHLYMDFSPDTARRPGWLKLFPMYRSPNSQESTYRIDISGNEPFGGRESCEKDGNGQWQIVDYPD